MSDVQPTAATPNSRLIFLDLLRVMGMLDIVSFHATGRYLLGGVGLPMFLLTSVAVIVRQPMPKPVAEVAARRARAILIPWLFWSVAYLPLLMWREWRNDRSAWDLIQPSMLLYGTSIHLWFLPMILPANLFALWVARRWANIPANRVALAATGIGAAVLLISAYVRTRFPIGPPFGQWIFSLACIPLGLAVGRAISLGQQRRRVLTQIALISAILFVVIWLAPRSAPIEWWLVARFAAALCLISIASMWSGNTHPILQTLVRSTLGIYLVHPMLITITSEYCLRVDSLLGETLLMYFGSLLFVLALRKTALGRFV